MRSNVFLRSRWRLAALAAVVLAAAGAACDSVPLTAPTNSTITMSAPTRTLPLNGSTQISAMVLESGGTPVQNGTTVRFTTTLGTVQPVEAQTRNGMAEVTFLAGDQSGIAEIRAVSGGAGGGTTTTPGTGNGGTTTATATNVVNISIGSAAIAPEGGVTLRANPTSVSAGGGTVELVATVIGDGGRALPGIPVSFNATRGTLAAGTALTDQNGEARTTLVTNEQTEVTARAGTRVSPAVTITARGVSSVSLAVDPSSPVALQPMTLTVTPSLGTGNAPPRVVVNWGDDTPAQDLGLVAAARGVTHIYREIGFYTISVTATTGGDTFTTEQAVQVIAQPTLSVGISASDTTPAVNQDVTFTATVTGVASDQITSYEWRILLNGSLEAQQTTTANQLIRRFSSTGNRTVSVTVRSSDNRTATSDIAVAVN